MLEKVKSKLSFGSSKIYGLLLLALATVNSFAAGLEVPASASTTLIGYIESNFAIVMEVVIVSIAVNIIIGMFKKGH